MLLQNFQMINGDYIKYNHVVVVIMKCQHKKNINMYKTFVYI